MKEKTVKEHFVAAIKDKHSSNAWMHELNSVCESGTVAELETYDGLTFIEWCAMMDEYETEFLPSIHSEEE